MLRLLILRAVPLLLRPAVILLEGILIASEAILVLALPLAMMALMISSIPVHLDYFKSQTTHSDRARLAQEYISGLTWLCLISLLILGPLLILLPLELSSEIVAAVCLLFLTEKLADETSRALEFRKAFVKWFLVQSLRSGWMLVPIASTLVGIAYEVSFLLSSAVACGIMILLYLKELGLKPRLCREGLKPIRRNMVFLAGSFLPASYQQLPRILIAKIFPEQAHIYLAVAQVAQGVNLIFNVRFQVPYRKVIAQKPITFQRRLEPAMLKVLVSSGMVAFIYLPLPLLVNVIGLPDVSLAILLAPIVIANALTFSVLSTYLGYIQWFARKYQALTFYLVCVAIASAVGVVVKVGLSCYISMLGIPSLAIVIALIWLYLVKACFFSNKAKDV